MIAEFFYVNGFAKDYAGVIAEGNPKGYLIAYEEAKMLLIKRMLADKSSRRSILEIADIHSVSYNYIRRIMTKMEEEKKKPRESRMKEKRRRS